MAQTVTSSKQCVLILQQVKGQSLLNHISVESFGGKVQLALAGGRNEREDIVSPFM